MTDSQVIVTLSLQAVLARGIMGVARMLPIAANSQASTYQQTS
jgi:hypothetical protein